MKDTETRALSESWWLTLIRGILAILLGITFLAWPAMSVFSLTIFIGIWALVNGVVGGIEGLIGIGKNKNWWLALLEGILGLIVGLIILKYPVMSLVTLYQLFALWAIISGIAQVIMALFMKAPGSSKALMAIGGICSVILGVLLLSNILAGFVAFTWLVGIYGIVVGIFMTVFSFRVRELQHEVTEAVEVKKTTKERKKR